MKKLKDLLKESFVWDRQFGEKLPTLASVQKKKNEGKLDEANVSSKPYKAWQEHGDNNNKLYNDAHWAMKAIPHKKKEIKEIQKLSSKLKNLIAIIQGQAMDL